MTKLDKFTESYIVCALWSSSIDDEGEPLDDSYGVDDISAETLDDMVRDCEDFQRANAELLSAAFDQGQSIEYSGHDFWLTRNGHGAGFWDRGLGDIGEKLSEAARAYGSYDLYVGDDGLIYGA